MTQGPSAEDIAAVRKSIPEINLIKDETLAMGVASVWAILWRESSYAHIEDAPVSPHLIGRSLVVQSRCVAMMAWDAAKRLEQYHEIVVNYDHLLAGCLLLDASKLVEYSFDSDGSLVRTPLRQQFPHTLRGAEVARQLGLPDPVVHIIFFHTPRILLNPAGTEPLLAQGADITAVDALYLAAGRPTARLQRDPDAGNIK